jgi:ribonuclease-3
VAEDLDLGSVLRLGKGEASSGGRSKPSILADALEAVFGAVFLDRGLDAVGPLILDLLDDRISASAEGPGGHDFKTRLQELAARHFERLPDYQVRDEGPDHQKRFFATVLLDGQPHGTGEGRSKKLSEQAAARSAWELLVAELDGAQPPGTGSPNRPRTIGDVARTGPSTTTETGPVPTATAGSHHPESESRDA